MRKNLSLLVMLLLAFSLFGCGFVVDPSGVDSSAPVVIELAQPSTNSSPQLTAEPTASPTPEAESWPVPIEGNDAPIGDGSGNIYSGIWLIPYKDKLFYIGQPGNGDDGRAPQNLWQINRDGSERSMIIDEDTIIQTIADQYGYDAGPCDVYKVEDERIYFFVIVSDANGNTVYQIYSVNMQGDDMRLEEEDTDKYEILNYDIVAGNDTYTLDNNQIIRKPAIGETEVLYHDDAYTIISFSVQGDWVYLIEQKQTEDKTWNMRCVSVQTHAVKTIMELALDPGFFVTPLIVHGNWIYFLNNERMLCRVLINGGPVEIILNSPVYVYLLYDHTLFYYLADMNKSEPGSFYFSTLLRRVDLNGENDTAIDVID